MARTTGDSEDEQIIKRMSKEAAAVKSVLDVFGHEYFPIYLEIMEHKYLEQASVIGHRYEIGAHFVRVSKKNTLAEAAIGEATKYTRTQIRDYKLVASRISRAELTSFHAKRNKSDEYLTWSHLYCLAGVQKEARPKVLQLTLEKNWSAGMLEDYIVSELPATDRIIEATAHNPAGRPFTPPKTLPALLHATGQRISSTERYLATVVATSFQNLVRDTPPDKIDVGMMQEMQELSQDFSELINLLESQKGDLDRAMGELTKSRGLPTATVSSPTEKVKAKPVTKPTVKVPAVVGTKVMPPGRRRSGPVPPKVRRG